MAAISPIGGPHVVRYTTSMHDERAYLTGDPEVIGRMMEHLEAKITAHADDIARFDADLQPGADTLVVAYGVTARAAREAVARARRAGIAASLLVLKTLFPVPETALARALEGVRRVVVPEANLGQYVEEVRRRAGGREVVSVAKMNTDLLSPEEIALRGGLL